jgi:hypothetical protein
MNFERIVELNNKTLDALDLSMTAYPSVFEPETILALREAINEYRTGTPNLDVVFFLATQISVFRTLRLWESVRSTVTMNHQNAAGSFPVTPNWY